MIILSWIGYRGKIMNVDYLNGKSFMTDICKKIGKPEFAFVGSSLEQLEQWQKDTVAKLEKVLCFDRIKDRELSYEKIEEKKGLVTEAGSKYSRILWNVNTAEGLVMPVYELRPDNGNCGPAIAVHCHGADGKNGIVGIIREEIKLNKGKYSFFYGFELLEKGYTVFCPDVLGSGERKPVNFDKPRASDCTIINCTLMAMGLNLHGVIIWELKKLIDFIGTFDFAEKPICVGFSSGGLETLWLAAMDKRIKTAYVSGYFHSFRSTLMQSNFCGCNFIPDLWKLIDMDTLAQLAAPTPLYVETGKDDKLNGIDGLENVYGLVETVKNTYKMFGAEDKFKFSVCDGAHRWFGAFMDEI